MPRTRRKTASGDTPLMQQYREIKTHHPDAILFFRMGDFYEMFCDDAELASRALGLTLTSRNNGGAANVPLAGVPVKAAADYLRRLIELGHRVAICEQVEDPKQAKGLVKREVVEIVTPGAILDEDWLDSKRNNYLVSVFPGEPYGLAAIDLSTGEFVLETVAPADVEAALQRLDPREIVVPADCDFSVSGNRLVTTRPGWEFEAAHAVEEITRRFALAGLEGLGIEEEDRSALCAAAALLRYAADLQPSGLEQITRPSLRRMGGTVLLDEMTRRNLELVETLRPGGGPTLLSVLDRTKTSMGARTLRQWLLAPLNQSDQIRARLDAVEVLVGDSRGRERLRTALDGVRDIERLAGRAGAGRATPRDLGALRDSLARLTHTKTSLAELEHRDQSLELERITTNYDLLTDLREPLTDYLDEDPPYNIGDKDSIKRGADEELDEARDMRDGGKRFIAELQARERQRTGIASLKVGFNRVFGYYIEVTKANRHLTPENYERRQTLTNAERYVTPELKEYEARVLDAEERVEVRERQLIDQLCAEVKGRLGRLQNVSRLTAELDVYGSLAETACREAYVRPDIADDSALDLIQCRHPTVEQVLPRGKFIPNDIHLDEASRVILLTGPNMAGKSTILRQVGLTVSMAQMGSYVPAGRAKVGVVDRIFTRVGASDNLAQGQSTFMVEMSETSAILHGATARSLVLLDEIGRGTSTYDGVAIAWAVTEHLHDRTGCKTIFATHYHELTQLTEELEHARNYNVAVKETGDEIIFLHKLLPGSTDRSYGIHVAKLAGLPLSVVTKSREILQLLESQHHVANQKPPAPPDEAQITLFNDASQLVEDLRKLDPENMTPVEALNRLAELKRQLGG